MCNIYLVNIEYKVSKYMCDDDDDETIKKSHLVHAMSEAEAFNKVDKYYTDKSDIYSEHYTIHWIEVCETIN